MMAKECYYCYDTYARYDGLGPTQFSEGPVERFCARLLPLLGRLTALSLFVPKAPHLLPFNELEHLELHCVGFNSESLMGLHSLKTLFLSSTYLAYVLPELRLKGLSKLCHVRLDDVFPAGLSLPSGCRLDIGGEAIHSNKLIGAAWQDALQHLHACTCKWTLKSKLLMNVQSLPSFLSMAAGSIQELHLVGTQPPQDKMLEVTIQLDPNVFCNLKQLRVKSNSLFQIHIPATVQLDGLQIYVDVLGLSFEDAMVSCRNLTDVNVFFRTTTGTSILELLYAPLAKNCMHARLLTHHQLYMGVTCLPPSPEGDSREMERALNIFQGAPLSCRCTMCWACMRH